MSAVFADTFYFLALLNCNDEAHSKASAMYRVSANSSRRNGCSQNWPMAWPPRANGACSCKPARNYWLTRNVQVAFTMELYLEGIQLYGARPDKEWSLTDCISFLVMRREALSDALTGDHHFEQAGFVALLK